MLLVVTSEASHELAPLPPLFWQQLQRELEETKSCRTGGNLHVHPYVRTYIRPSVRPPPGLSEAGSGLSEAGSGLSGAGPGLSLPPSLPFFPTITIAPYRQCQNLRMHLCRRHAPIPFPGRFVGLSFPQTPFPMHHPCKGM